jgi:hypothetical protein
MTMMGQPVSASNFFTKAIKLSGVYLVLDSGYHTYLFTSPDSLYRILAFIILICGLSSIHAPD